MIIDALINLKCLFLQQNCIQQLENLQNLTQLDTLNVANNLLKKIDNLNGLSKITSLNVSHNFLHEADDIAGVLECPTIAVLDLSHNKLYDPKIVDILEQLPNLVLRS